jgi:hypothetical protein
LVEEMLEVCGIMDAICYSKYTSFIVFERLETSATSMMKDSRGHSYHGEALPGKWKPYTLTEYCWQLKTFLSDMHKTGTSGKNFVRVKYRFMFKTL